MTHRNEMTQEQTDKLYDHHRQQLSAMLDGELAPDQARFMLRRLEHDRELAACWERWQVCGDVLRGRHEALLPADFSRRVADAIAGQDVAAPAQLPAAAHGRSRWARWGGGAALAASVAMAALFVGRQAPEATGEPAAPATVVASAAAPDDATQPAPARPAPAAPTPDRKPDVATTLATAVAAAEVPRRAAERRASRGQQQRAASRIRREAQAPVRVAAAGSPPAAAVSPAPDAVLQAQPAPTALAAEAGADPFAGQPPAQARPWPRAILPGFPAEGALTASYGSLDGSASQHPFHPFEPRVALPRQSEDAPAAPVSGPR
jgi:negative regulator of sigma E activity